MKKCINVKPLELRLSEKSVVEVVAVDVSNGTQIGFPEMTKPPEGGLSPLEHLAKPSGQKVSRGITIQQNSKFTLCCTCNGFQIELKPIKRSRGAHKPLDLQAYRLRPTKLGQTKYGLSH